MDDSSPVVVKPLEVVFGAFEALVGHVRSRGSRTHADEPFVGIGSCGEEGLGHLLVGGGGSSKAESGDDPGRVNGGEQAKAYRYQPMLLDQPMSASPASHPCPRRFASRMGIAELSRAS